jgi:hypothetical protein
MAKTACHFIKNGQHQFRVRLSASFIRLRLNTLQLAAGMKSEVNCAEAHQSEGGLKFEPNAGIEQKGTFCKGLEVGYKGIA